MEPQNEIVYNSQSQKRWAVWGIFFAIGIIISIRAKRGFWVGFLITTAAGLVGSALGIFAFPEKKMPNSTSPKDWGKGPE
ncbi:hypothetical protein JYU20_00410 [Bacteroidales bacterium AH-315-I05]|nr:hypothetical protein [Bacteroidales bacterium AH-315-I05]